MTHRIALVGHCGPDAFMLRSLAQRVVAGGEVSMINDASDLEKNLPDLDLLLVNRVLDGRFTDESGIELIRSLVGAADAKTPMILISNFEDAQADAVAAGAQPGFGKRDVNTPHAKQRIADALA